MYYCAMDYVDIAGRFPARVYSQNIVGEGIENDNDKSTITSPLRQLAFLSLFVV